MSGKFTEHLRASAALAWVEGDQALFLCRHNWSQHCSFSVETMSVSGK